MWFQEKKQLEEQQRQLIDDLQNEEAKAAQASRLRAKLEQTLDEMEEAVERERRYAIELFTTPICTNCKVCVPHHFWSFSFWLKKCQD